MNIPMLFRYDRLTDSRGPGVDRRGQELRLCRERPEGRPHDLPALRPIP